ncbi:epoxide hydrolase [Mitsuaria sp. GD03876]|uniref:epoxide hydrolase family protein n=1 Tax=Mitsuaria sp. GD03876 TaxID=2975399 RepID=UPI002447E70F|nr:epoxide hydrolase [Mitsuaria sp. GD03876]MDH0867519.1 epoxide hydrolase [Mitsuaria sp. GD03876]
MKDLREFKIAIPDERLEDLARRLRHTRWPDADDEDGWDDGTSLRFARRLADHWLHRFDWRAQESRLNQLPQYLAQVGGIDIHFVHVRGRGPAPMPLILTHGWPGSFAEMARLVPMLTDPAAHGGDAADAFDVVVPSLPGYGFSRPAPTGSGSARHVATLWRELMAGLGYPRFGAQGGDIGAGVSTWLARLHPESLAGVHLNFIPGGFRPSLEGGAPPLSTEESAFLDRIAAWRAVEGGYLGVHATKPQSLAYGLADSPMGLAAWIVEKFRAWSDCGGDVESAFTLDELLTDICLHWFGDVRASLRMYKDNFASPLVFAPGERLTTPFAMAHFPREMPTPPRSWPERALDIRRWTEMPRGGHFAAMEQPELLAQDLREFFRPLRPVT